MKETSKARKFDFPLYDEIDNNMSDITAIYLRVSTDTQAQEGYGLDVQYNNIKKYITAFDIANPVIFVDDGYTGMNEKRPAFQAMKTLMNMGRIKFVITFSLDRIGRTQMIILKFLKEQCEKCKCDFLAVKDNVDSRSKQTYGILISILSIFAEFDHDAIVAKLTAGRKQRASEGYWKGGGNPPYGYYYSKELNNLAVIPEQAITVKKVFEMYNTTEYSPRLIAEALGLSSDVLVYNILKNRTYLGEITFQGEQYQGLHQRIMDCTVPFGSGLSSSAAIEVSTIAALATVAGEEFDPVDVALKAQQAEREYAGVNCGIMDQYASACGKKNHAILLDCKTLEREYVPVSLGDYSLVIIQSPLSVRDGYGNFLKNNLKHIKSFEV